MKSFSTPIRFMLISSFLCLLVILQYTHFSYLSINLSPFSAFQVGTVLTVIIITSRVIPLFSGLIVDKIGYIIMMIAGLF